MNLVQATVLIDATAANPGEPKAKPTSTTPGQTEVSLRVWEGNDVTTGIWEVTPGTFTATREGYNEICQILSGTATITEVDGGSFDVGPGSLFVTPAGWRGSWTVHEPLRKMWVVHNLPAQKAD